MASIRAYRTKGGERKYAVRWREGGKQREQAVGHRRSDALRVKQDKERQQSLGALYDAEPETLGDFLDAWLVRYEHQVSEGTVRATRSTLKVFDSLRHVRIDRLSAKRVEDAVSAKAKRRPAQAANALQKLRLALKDAERRGQRVDPQIAKVPKPRRVRREPRFLTWPEVQLAALHCTEPDVVILSALTGLRRDEMQRLERRDVDLEQHTVRVRSGKTSAAARTVPLPEAGLAAICRLLKDDRQRICAELLPAWRWDRDVWHPALAASGLGRVRWHDLRHTYAALMVRAGTHPKVLQRLMGHRSITTTLDTYGGLYPDAYDDAIRGLDNLTGDAA